LGSTADLTLAQLEAMAARLAGMAAPTTTLAQRVVGANSPAETAPVRSPDLPSGTVTFLFTDIEGSTQLWEQHPQAMPAVLARHDALLRQVVASHGGVVFKTVGDSLHAAFARAPAALGAALAAQRALQQEVWGLAAPLRVRMALHSGAVEPREGDYFGPPLNRVARLLSLGHGGQILLSRATHDLVVDDLPDRAGLRALGEYVLKDLTRPEQVFQCVGPDIAADFPPLNTSQRTASSATRPGLPILATKLYVPRARPTLLSRPRLLVRLNAALQEPLILISAPAGFGKTTLLADWLASRSDESRVLNPELSEKTQNSKLKTQNFHVAWLSLDERDQDAHQFLRYLIAALQTIAPDCGRTALDWLDGALAPPETVLTLLVNDLIDLPNPSVLVLDDYHVVRAPAIHAAVAFLLDHLPPAVHLVLASREDPPLPLARLRARGQLAELRAADLHFTLDEAATLLDTGLGLRLDEGQIAMLVARTEGWATGLQLAGLALRDRPDPVAFVAAFAGSHRLVADYLMTEVIDLLPSDVRRFLLSTSVLNRLCASLCEAMLAPDNNNSDLEAPTARNCQAALEALERANLFVVPLDDERRWYRYHHLFADALRARVMREVGLARINELYRRARVWHEQHDLGEEAVNYALAGRDWPAASKILEKLSTSLWASSRHILKWIESLPAEEVQQSPELCIWYASWQMLGGDFGRVDQLLDTAERILRSTGQDARLDSVYSTRTMASFLREDGEPTVEYSRRAMLSIGEGNRLVYIAMSEALARGYYLKGELAEAERLWAEAGELARAAGSQRTLLFVRAAQGELQRARGNIRRAVQLDQELLQQIAALPVDILKIRAYTRLASQYYEWNQLERAEQSVQQALEQIGQTGRDVFTRSASITQARIYAALGDANRAFEIVERAIELARHMGGEHPLIEAEAARVRLWLAYGGTSPVAPSSAASDWAAAQRFDFDSELAYGRQPMYLALCRVFIAQNRPDQAVDLLERLMATARAAGRAGELVELLVLKALAHQAHHQADQAFAALADAFVLAEPEGYIRTFVDEGRPLAELLEGFRERPSEVGQAYLDSVLAAFPAAKPQQPIQRQADRTIEPVPYLPISSSAGLLMSEPLVEPLSKREREVLALMAQGFTNAEIAQHLIISAETVKVHTRNIYGKLGVNGRRQAVAMARAEGLLA
jgi:LuxR family maltose regulon positive regulatory protein